MVLRPSRSAPRPAVVYTTQESSSGKQLPTCGRDDCVLRQLFVPWQARADFFPVDVDARGCFDPDTDLASLDAKNDNSDVFPNLHGVTRSSR